MTAAQTISLTGLMFAAGVVVGYLFAVLADLRRERRRLD